MILIQLYGRKSKDEQGLEMIDRFICRLRRKIHKISNGKTYIKNSIGKSSTQANDIADQLLSDSSVASTIIESTDSHSATMALDDSSCQKKTYPLFWKKADQIKAKPKVKANPVRPKAKVKANAKVFKRPSNRHGT